MSRLVKFLIGLAILLSGWALGTLLMLLGMQHTEDPSAWDILLIFGGVAVASFTGGSAGIVWIHGFEIYQELHDYRDRRKARRMRNMGGAR